MFTQLAPMVRTCEKVVITLAMQGDTMSVVVVPVVKNPADAALTMPLALSATPEELDAGFAEVVRGTTESRKSLAEQAEATNSILDAAKASQSNKATKALTKANSSESSNASDDSSEEDGDEKPVAQAATDATAPAVASTGTDLSLLI
ncbi:PRTRC system protein E [Cupriavidus sp. YR651]|uniref:PRTRC system protein E n=1 Tax=Cupriavidus sp. YR651 TaxID=1855315 RepID=UPI00088EBF0F|nr:PRTRC system protein E [Cupriavidus sp. YR651]SDD58309.1 PRTRC system protein E [Cupriavidus sp. YR651]